MVRFVGKGRLLASDSICRYRNRYGFSAGAHRRAAKKAYTFTAAAEVSAVLPYQFKLYTNAQLPVDILNQTIADWGVLAGASKSFVFTAFTLSTIAEAAYSKEGLAYGLFQNAAISDYLQILGGIQGLESQKIIGIMQSEFFIADFKLKLTYATKNLITAASEGKSQAGTPYIGTFSISIRLGGS